ncbi:MAG: hypothetical protein EXR69_00680 [Myxococcales bacterium]|nr:hypothetical protein [Myxococcales bacterium]
MSPDTGEQAVAPAVSQARGNDAAQAGIPAAATDDKAAQGAGGGDSGLANYEAALGEFLGGELYKAIAPSLGYEKLSGAAKKGVDSALDALVKQFGSLDNVTADPKALDVLGKLLKDSLDPLVDEWLKKHGPGLAENLTEWVGAHPRTIVLTALLAAAGAIIANVGIPTLKQKFALGKGLSAEVEAKLGKLRDISLQRVRATLTYESGPLLAAVSAGRDDKGTTGEVHAAYKGEGKSLTADATYDGKGLKFAGLNGVIDTSAGQVSAGVNSKRGDSTIAGVKVSTKDGKLTDTKDFQYNATTGIFSLGLGSVYSDGGLTVDRKSTVSSDGSSSSSQSIAAQSTKDGVTSGAYAGISHESSKTPFGMTETDKLTFGMNYSKEDFKAKLDAALSSNGTTSLAGSLKNTDGEHSYGGDFLTKSGNEKLWEVGGFYGFKSRDEFRSYVLDYRYKSDVEQSKFGLLVEQEIKGTYMRWQSSVTWGGANTTKLDTSLQAARYINDDTALIGGARYQKDFGTDKSSINPQIGVQYKGIPILAEYNTQTKGVMLGITIPFGR